MLWIEQGGGRKERKKKIIKNLQRKVEFIKNDLKKLKSLEDDEK